MPTHTKTHTIRHRFTHRARIWSLYQRCGVWYLVSEYKGKRLHESCGESALKTAVRMAKLKIDALVDGNAAAARRLMQRKTVHQWPSIADLLAAFDRLPIKHITGLYYKSCLLNVLRSTHDGDPLRLSTTALNSDTAHAWFRLARERGMNLSQADANRALRGARSIFMQAKAVVSQRAVQDMAQDGLLLPDVSGFTDYAKPKATPVTYLPPPAALIRRTLHEWLKLPRNEFIAAGIALSCGLRKSAIANLTWKQLAEAVESHAETDTKDKSGLLRLRPIDPFWTVFNRRVAREHWRTGETVLEGIYTERAQRTFNRIGQWMRSLGWRTQKTNHALRAYAGSLVIAKWGIYRGSRWLHHKSVSVTEKHYSHFVDDLEINPRRIVVRWAK